MTAADKQIAELLAKFGEDFQSNTWIVPGGKSRAIYHKTIERIAAQSKIRFDRPEVISADPQNVVVVVTGHSLDGHTEWSFGEASPKNCKNAYPYSMAEKRGKDRVVLKLVGLHGFLYSEDELDDLKEDRSAKVPEAPLPPERNDPAPAKAATPPPSQRTIANALMMSLKSARNSVDLQEWLCGNPKNIKDTGGNQKVIDTLPDDLKSEVRQAYVAKLNEFRRGAA
jgi:hypothetical protein